MDIGHLNKWGPIAALRQQREGPLQLLVTRQSLHSRLQDGQGVVQEGQVSERSAFQVSLVEPVEEGAFSQTSPAVVDPPLSEFDLFGWGQVVHKGCVWAVGRQVVQVALQAGVTEAPGDPGIQRLDQLGDHCLWRRVVPSLQNKGYVKSTCSDGDILAVSL